VVSHLTRGTSPFIIACPTSLLLVQDICKIVSDGSKLTFSEKLRLCDEATAVLPLLHASNTASEGVPDIVHENAMARSSTKVVSFVPTI
jgi:hypothetical protein